MGVDVARLFREYVRLDRMHREGGLSPRDLARWKDLKRRLGKHFSPGLSDARADQRESVRVPTRLHVRFDNDGALANCLLTNLSRKGVFIETGHPVEIGTRLELTILVTRPRREIRVPAEVVSHGLGPRLIARSGMGLRLLEADPEVQKELDDLYERLVR